MKSVSKDSVKDITNYVLDLLDKKLSSLENRDESQKQSLHNIRQEINKIDKNIDTICVPDDKTGFQICESLSVELKAYLRSKPSENLEGQNQPFEGNGDIYGFDLTPLSKKEEVGIDIRSPEKGSPQKLNKIRQGSLSNTTPDKNMFKSPKALPGRTSSTKKA